MDCGVQLLTRPAWAGFKNCGTRLPPYQENKIKYTIGSKIGSIIGRLNQKSDPMPDLKLDPESDPKLDLKSDAKLDPKSDLIKTQGQESGY